jgi:hypothetical protein
MGENCRCAEAARIAQQSVQVGTRNTLSAPESRFKRETTFKRRINPNPMPRNTSPVFAKTAKYAMV